MSSDEISNSDSGSDYDDHPVRKRPRVAKPKKPSKRLKDMKKYFIENEAPSADEDEESDLGEISDGEKREAESLLYKQNRRVDPIFDPSADAEKQAQMFAYRVFDVVTLSAEKSFGIVVKVESNCVRAIMNDGDKRIIRFSEINKKYDPRRSQAQDLEGNALSLGDMVRVMFSKHQFYEKTGAIRNCHAGTLFIFNTYFVATDSILPVKANYCVLLGAQSDVMGTFSRASDWVGKLVSINSGPYRGQTGRVTSCNEKMATIQLNSASKTITIDRGAITPLEKGDIGMKVETAGEFAKTPAHSPGWARTPAYDDTSSPWRGTPGRDFARSPSANRAYR